MNDKPTVMADRNGSGPRAPALFNFIYGLYVFCMFTFYSIKTGRFFSTPTEKEKNDLAIERDKLWNLSKSWSGFRHYFLKLRDGVKIHYVSNEAPDKTASRTKPLFILIHGFPDSWALWRHLLHSYLQNIGILVAFDLPGYGGSDSLNRYGATEVLEALTEFITEIREQYGFDYSQGGNGDRKVFIVGHDWGCVLGARLASEAPDLADRFILSNAPMPQLLIDNATRVAQSSTKMFKMFLHHPVSSRGLLRKSISTMLPLLHQLQRFGYSFAFQLPNFFIRQIGSEHSIFLPYIHKLAAGKVGAYTSRDAAESMASTIGPSTVECKSLTNTNAGYPKSVLARQKRASDFFIHQTALYRDGAVFDRWNKSLETIAVLHSLRANDLRQRSSSGAGLFDDGQKQMLQQKTTVVWGQQDSALIESVVLDGIHDYLPRGSQVVLLPRTGHFTPIEKESRMAFEKVLEWVAGGGKENLTDLMEEVYHGAVVSVNK